MANNEQKRLAKETILGTIWVYAANYSGKALVFISTTILARLLTKADYGLAGYALVVIGFLDVLVDLGVGAALIYYPETESSRNTAFWLNVLTSGFLFGMTFLLAPLAGDFFNDPRAIPLTRVMALTFPISALGNIHASLLAKHLTFKKKFIPDITKALGKGLVSIVLAYFDFGAWSLVLGQVGGTALGVIALWIVQPWRPKLALDPRQTKSLLKYGVNIVAVDALGVTLNNVDYLFVGRILGAEALGVYTLAFRIPELLVKNLVNLVGNVLFPAYSRLKDDMEALQKGFIISMQSISMFTIPVALGLVAVARPMILTLFTEKWEEAIPVTSLIAVYTLIRSLTFNIGNLYKAQGKPEILTKLSLVKIPFLFAGLWWATSGPGTIVAVAQVQVGVALISALLNMIVAARVLSTPVRRIIRAFQPALVAGLVMLVTVSLLLSFLQNTPESLQLVAGVLAGVFVYGVLVYTLQREFVLKVGSNLKVVFDRG